MKKEQKPRDRSSSQLADDLIWRSFKSAESSLNAAYKVFKVGKALDQFFLNMLMQTRTFQFELVLQMTILEGIAPTGFARAVAMKGLIHLVVEYRKHLDTASIPTMLKYAASRGIPFEEVDVRALRARYRPTFKEIDGWEKIRNKATGHYDGDVELVVQLMESVDYEAVIKIVRSFMTFNVELITLLRKSGLPDDHPERQQT
ncbi:hypothetical protein [Burkholderia gladioli]|uniref:hypothetical protein n=1 Tax=Burkholderia gladioli TaxID=28095 RepID=UPI00163F42B8|nr:hypothetical protein [Burkholderia gladioli]